MASALPQAAMAWNIPRDTPPVACDIPHDTPQTAFPQAPRACDIPRTHPKPPSRSATFPAIHPLAKAHEGQQLGLY